MQATIISFPLRHGRAQHSVDPTMQGHYLGLAALWLNDNGFNAMTVTYSKGKNNLSEGLSTDAALADVDNAFCHAYSNLCAFLVDQMEFETDDLPLLVDLLPRPSRVATSNYEGGQVFGYV
jgi:hypothetical protein